MGSSDQRPWRRPPTARRIAVAGLVAALLMAGLAASWSARRQGEHTATAVVMLHPLAGNAYSPGGRGDELVNLETEAEVLRSEAVAGAVSKKLGGGAPDELLAAITVSVPPNTQLLQIIAHGPDDATAIARASAFASVYLAFRRARTESAVFDQVSRLEDLVDARATDRAQAIRDLARTGATSAERPILQHQVDELTVQISSLREQLVTAEAEPLDAGQVVSPGRVQDQGVLSRPLVTGGLAGSAVLLGIALLLLTRAQRLHLGTIGSLDDLADLAPLGSAPVPVPADSELVARVRSAVLAARTSRPRVVLLTRADDGRAALHRPLVTALTNARYHVVAVDLGRPSHVAALRQLVLEDAAVDDVLAERRPFLSTLRPTGTTAASPTLADLASSAGMTRSLHELAKRADVVVVTGGGLGTAAGRALLATAAGVVIEVCRGATTHEQVDAARLEADRVDCEVLGLVLVRPGSDG